jgi:outer membrane usher protein
MDISAGYSQGHGYNSQNLNLAGSIVGHAGGINLGQTVGETFALAQVEGVEGVKIGSFTGASTGNNGFAVVPNAQPYRVNWINLDTAIWAAMSRSTMRPGKWCHAVVPWCWRVTPARPDAACSSLVRCAAPADPFGASLDSAGKQLAISDPGGKALALVEPTPAPDHQLAEPALRSALRVPGATRR